MRAHLVKLSLLAILTTGCGSGDPPGSAPDDAATALDAGGTGIDATLQDAPASPPSPPPPPWDGGPIACAAPISAWCGPGTCPTWSVVSACGYFGATGTSKFSQTPCGGYDLLYTPHFDTPGGVYAVYDAATGALVASVEQGSPPVCTYGPSSFELPAECFSAPLGSCMGWPEAGVIETHCLPLSQYCGANPCPSWSQVAACGSTASDAGFTATPCAGYLVESVFGGVNDWLFSADSGAPVALIATGDYPGCNYGPSTFEIPVACLTARLGGCWSDAGGLDAGSGGD